MIWLIFIFGALGAFFFIHLLRQARPAIAIEDAQAALVSGTAVLVDVREPDEWASGVAQDSATLPFSDLRGGRVQWAAFLKKNRGKKLLLYCASGTRSGFAAAQLRREGFDALNAGSLSAWSRADWPICVPQRR